MYTQRYQIEQDMGAEPTATQYADPGRTQFLLRGKLVLSHRRHRPEKIDVSGKSVAIVVRKRSRLERIRTLDQSVSDQILRNAAQILLIHCGITFGHLVNQRFEWRTAVQCSCEFPDSTMGVGDLRVLPVEPQNNLAFKFERNDGRLQAKFHIAASDTVKNKFIKNQGHKAPVLIG